NANAPSRIAAGVIKPGTGRRLGATWVIDGVMPFAWDAYLQIGHELGITAIFHKKIIYFFSTPQIREAFLKKIEEDGQYAYSYPEQNHFNNFFKYDFGCGEIRPAYLTHLEALLPAWRRILLANKQLVEADFVLGDLKISEKGIDYGDIKAEKII